MHKRFKTKTKKVYLKLLNYNVPISLQEEKIEIIKQNIIQLNKTYCVLNFDDLSPIPDNSSFIGRGGDINDDVSVKFKNLLQLFPNIGVTHFMVPNFQPSDWNVIYNKNKYSIQNTSNCKWLYYYLELSKQYNIEFACHGLHHRQYNNFLFARNTEFAYLNYSKALSLLKSSIEVFEQVGIKPIGFRPPGWDINSDLSIIDAIDAAGLKYSALNSYDGGLNSNTSRVSNTHPVKIKNIINFPDNINIDWSIEKIYIEIKNIINLGGIVSIKCHYSKDTLTNALTDENYAKLIVLLKHINKEYAADVQFASFKDVYYEINKNNPLILT